MRFSSHQPLYNTAVYMLDRIASVDVFMMHGEAKVTKGFQTQLQLIARQGPVLVPLPLDQSTRGNAHQIKVHKPAKWAARLTKQLQSIYGKQEGWREHGSEFTQLLGVLGAGSPTVYDVGWAMTQWVCGKVGLQDRLIEYRVLAGGRQDDPNEWLVRKARLLGADTFVGGKKAAASWMDLPYLKVCGVYFEGQDYQMPPYEGLSDPVPATVSALDPLFVGGVEGLKRLLPHL